MFLVGIEVREVKPIALNLQGPDPSSAIPFLLAKLADAMDEVVGGLILAAIFGILAYLRSPRFRGFAYRVWLGIKRAFASAWLWVVSNLALLIGLILLLVVVFASNLIFTSFSVGVLLIVLAIAIILLVRPRQLFSGRKQQSQPRFQPVEIRPGVGNRYLNHYFREPPLGETEFESFMSALLPESRTSLIEIESIPFALGPKSLVFDTSGQLRYFTELDEGTRKVRLDLPEPANNVEKIHFLINSGNSKLIYEWQRIGILRLIFGGEHESVYFSQPIDLILGDNIREWAPGNSPAEYVTRTSDPRNKIAWRGETADGKYAVIDRLEIPVVEFNQNLEFIAIEFFHHRVRHEEDDLGAQFMVFGITLELGNS